MSTTIRIDETTKEELRKLGTKGVSYNIIILKLIDEAHRKHSKVSKNE